MVILQRKIAGLGEQALVRFVLRARRAAELRGSVDVLVTSSAEMRSLNHRFRGKNKPTDVLSFAADSASHGKGTGRFAGEIAISADIARQSATRWGHSLVQEVKILVLHGILHLAGFDHERDNGQMARKEVELRRAFKLPSALTERGRRGHSMRKLRRAKVPPRTA